MCRNYNILLVFMCSIAGSTLSQNLWTHPADGPCFLQNELPTIRIECGESLEWMFEESNWYSDEEHPASFHFESESWSDSIALAGFRLRGNTSRAASKKSFKVSFDTFDENASWEGLKKLNLNGEHNDPSVIRSRLIWECMRDAGIPVSRATHVNLYINGAYHGVYANIEHIDRKWLEKRFELGHGNLWKCTYPSTLTYEGPNGDDYKFTPSWSDQRVYDLKTNKNADDYSSLAAFIDILNNTSLEELPCALEGIFDVHSYLRIAAMEVLAGHWDNYIGNKNNFYLYQRSTDGRLMYIPYDVDNTLGIQWFGNWTDQDPYEWTEETDRPLYSRLMQIPQYREAFTWNMRVLQTELFTADWIQNRGEYMINSMVDDMVNDTFYPMDYGFDLEGFTEAMDEAWGGHVAYGISEYAEARIFWSDIQLDPSLDFPPITTQAWALGPVLDDTLRVHFSAPHLPMTTLESIELELTWPNGNQDNYAMSLESNGEGGCHGSVQIAMNGAESVTYRVRTTRLDGLEHYSPCSPRLIWNQPVGNELVINEVMPLNNSFITDESGGYADWMELYNGSELPIYLGNYWLTNRITQPNRWRLPNVTMEPESHLLIWCDDDTEEGPLHASFQLDATSDDLYLIDRDQNAWRLIDNVEWSNSYPNFSKGRLLDGASEWIWFDPFSTTPPTPDAPNGLPLNIDVWSSSTPAWNGPNPLTSGKPIQLTTEQPFILSSATGRVIRSGFSKLIATDNLTPGLYLLELGDNKTQPKQSLKLILQRPY